MKAYLGDVVDDLGIFDVESLKEQLCELRPMRKIAVFDKPAAVKEELAELGIIDYVDCLFRMWNGTCQCQREYLKEVNEEPYLIISDCESF